MELQTILNDLQQVFPEYVTLPLPPYQREDKFEIKFTWTLKNLQKSIRRKQRISSLVNAFYMGQLLDQIVEASERLRYKKKMTSHYAIMAEKTYDLFEFYPELIMKTQILNVQIIRTLRRPQIEEIKNEMMIFAGAANLEEEPVNLE
jgi:hypothetical protein